MRAQEIELNAANAQQRRIRTGAPAWLAGLLTLIAMLVAVLVATSPAQAAWQIQSFDGAVLDQNGDPQTQAGSHPFTASTKVEAPVVTEADGQIVPQESIRNIDIALPPGLIGNPQSIPTCSPVELISGAAGADKCPLDSQVGTVLLTVRTGSATPVVFSGGVFNVEHPDGYPAVLAFNFYGTIIQIGTRVRTGGDYGIDLGSHNAPLTLPFSAVEVTLWGTPADPAHDGDRGRGGSGGLTGFPVCASPSAPATCSNPSDAPKVPFLTLPTSCVGPVITTARLTTWEGSEDTASFLSHDNATPTPNPIGVDGCENVPFAPTVQIAADHRRANAPTGLTFKLTVPQDGLVEPGGIASANLEKAVVTLPEGLRVNPSGADGLGSCSPAEIGLDTAAPARCPLDAKIGTVAIDTPLLGHRVEGSIYLADQSSFEHQLIAIYLTAADEESGIVLKLPGKVQADPRTGQLVATFDDQPQLPFSALELHFKGGDRAPLTMPRTCGAKPWSAELTPWSAADGGGGRAVTVTGTLPVDSGCARGFAPSFSAGTVSPVGNASSPLVVRFGRSDGDQELGAVNGSLPPGLLGVLASVPLCSAAQGAAGTCPATSRVGSVQVAAGTGAHPVWLPQAGRPENPVYLTEPYRKGDVAGMSIVVPAVAGPFDLGTVVTKVYLKLRDKDQGIDFQSDRLPRILQGIPLDIRTVAMTIDRKGFMVNPTNCSAMATYANVFSQSWDKAAITSRFQAANCAALPVSPVITAQAGGRGNVRRYEHPALRVSIRQSAAQAHLSKTNVVLPKALNVDLKAPALKASCPRDAYAKDECSPVATIGTVKAVTPLLREPLTGPAFLIQKKGQLPDIVMRLRNNRMSLDLIGVLDFLKDGRLITRVKGIPDAALSSFVLNIKGGKGGSLLNRSSLCARKRLVKATFLGQNGKLSRKSPVMHVAGCTKARAKANASARRSSRVAARRASARVSAAGGASASVARTAAARVAAADHRAVGGRP